jgi:hypothetical protein
MTLFGPGSAQGTERITMCAPPRLPTIVLVAHPDEVFLRHRCVIGLEPIGRQSAAMIAQQTMPLHTVLHRPKAL